MENDLFSEVKETKQEGEQSLHFYYSREHRLQNAPQSVKDFYDGKVKPVKGFKVLFTAQNRYILIALVLFVGFTWIYLGVNRTRTYSKINNISFEQQSFSYESEVFLNIKVFTSGKNKLKSPQKVNAKASFYNIDNQVLEEKELSVMFTGQEENLRTKVSDYDIIKVETLIKIGDEEKTISSSVIR